MLKVQYFDYLIWRADSLEKTLMLGKIEGRRRRSRGTDEMIGRHHWLNGHECEQALGHKERQGSLACYSSWSHKESDWTTEQVAGDCPILGSADTLGRSWWATFTIKSPEVDSTNSLCPGKFTLLSTNPASTHFIWWWNRYQSVVTSSYRLPITYGHSFNIYWALIMYQGLSRWLSGKNPSANAGDAGDPGLIPGLGRSFGVGNVNLLQYSCLKNSKDRGAWLATVHGVAKSLTPLSAAQHEWINPLTLAAHINTFTP